jgi:protein-S-isoprenylcysteine O-methyltransferase Ste14
VDVTDELLFRVVFSALWLAFFTNLAWVSRSAGWSVAEQKRGTWSNTRLRALAIVLAVPYFAGVFLYALLPSWVMFLSISLPDWFRFVMVGVAAVGISFLSWAYCVLGKNWGPSVSPMRKDTVLVTRGPYIIVRHPVYLGAFIFLTALVLVSANLLLILPTLALLVLLYRSIDEEEAVLLARFGDEYREYMKHTPRFIPNFRHMYPQQPKQPS